MAAFPIVSVLELGDEENRFVWDKLVPGHGVVVVEVRR
jgi:hypothetical protein